MTPAEVQREWRKKNPEKARRIARRYRRRHLKECRERGRAYQKTHRAELAAAARERRKKSPEKYRQKERDRRANNRELFNKYKLDAYRRNPAPVLARTRRSLEKRRARNLELVEALKKKVGCSVCGFADVRALVFHHRRGKKESSISDLVNRGSRTEKLQAEVKKCIVLCANCHAILHHRDAVKSRARLTP